MHNLFERRVFERGRAFVVACGVTLSLSAACLAWGGSIRGSGKVVSASREVAPFHAIDVTNGIQARLSVGPQKLELQGEDNILPLVVTEVRNGQLHIHFQSPFGSLSNDGVTVKITVPMLDGIEVSGGSEASGELGKSESLRLDASGGAELHLTGIDTQGLEAGGSGGSVVDLQGRADELKLDVSGGTQFPLEKLSVSRARIEGSGGSEGSLHASEAVRGALSGGSSLRVSGGAHARVSTSGGSSLDVD